jgi:DNA-binding response OmpR family regulator
VVILDLGLPDGDGLDLCRQLRKAGHRMPVLMLTARGTLDDRLEGFEAGTDDYLPKPFAFAELVARVTVLARRSEQLPPPPSISDR